MEIKGKRNLFRAFEAWVTFQGVFKGIKFMSVLQPVSELFHDQGRILDVYGAEYVWAQLEHMIREYRYEVVTTRARTSRRMGDHIVNQEDCVAFLLVLVEELVDKARRGEWDEFPHQRFYAPGSLFSMVTLPARGGTASTTATVTPTGKGGGQGMGSSEDSHRHGMCMWHLAGALKMLNAKQVPYQCRDRDRKHPALKSISIGKVRALVKDPSFMVCKTEWIKKALIQKVEENQKLFAN